MKAESSVARSRKSSIDRGLRDISLHAANSSDAQLDVKPLARSEAEFEVAMSRVRVICLINTRPLLIKSRLIWRA